MTRILVDITHPAHVHFYRNAITQWKHQGREVFITCQQKDITLDLLHEYGIESTQIGSGGHGFFHTAHQLLYRAFKLRTFIHQHKINVLTAIAGPYITLAGKLSGIPSVVFTDTENATLSNRIAFPLANAILTPESYRDRFSPKQITYPGFHELAYLHPRYFQPNPSILHELGLSPAEPFVIMRFVSRKAVHDQGHPGMQDEFKRQAVHAFSPYAKILISSETPLPADLQPYAWNLHHNKIHHALAYATLLYGESATMASEASMLGTASIFLDNQSRGYIDYLENYYESVFLYPETPAGQEESIAKGIELLHNKNTKSQWQEKQKRILNDCTDVTALIMETVERYAKPR